MRSTAMVAVLLIAEAAAFPQSSAQIQRCSTELVRYPERNTIHNPIFSLDLATSIGDRLVYIGARHTNDPADPQFVDIEKAWNDVKPTVAFYEGPVVRMQPTVD